MQRFSKVAGIVAAAALALLWALPAQAQATRTWISGVGDDVNPCSRTAPCKTFSGAISKTAAGGEIDCLDPGGFGAVTITKSMTLDCGEGPGGAAGGILNSGLNGIVVNDGNANTIFVKIRNVNLQGISRSPGGAGLSGIKFYSGAALIVEHVAIMGEGGTPGSNGGIDFEPSGAGAKLSVVDTDIQFGLADGVLIKPQSGGSATVVLSNLRSLANNGGGVRVDSTNQGSGTGNTVTVFGSTLAGNGIGAEAVTPGTTVSSVLYVTNTVASGNTSAGLLSNGANALIVVGGSTVTGNGAGLAQLGTGKVQSYGDNYFYNGTGGASNGTPTSPTITKL